MWSYTKSDNAISSSLIHFICILCLLELKDLEVFFKGIVYFFQSCVHFALYCIQSFPSSISNLNFGSICEQWAVRIGYLCTIYNTQKILGFNIIFSWTFKNLQNLKIWRQFSKTLSIHTKSGPIGSAVLMFFGYKNQTDVYVIRRSGKD